MKILFIDSDSTRLDLFCSFIDQGHKIIYAKDHKEAIQKLTVKHNFDLIFMDYALKTGTGYEVIDALPKAIKGHLYNSIIICHSMDPSGNIGMFTRLIQKGYRSTPLPFGAMIIQLKYYHPIDGEILKAFYQKMVHLTSSPE